MKRTTAVMAVCFLVAVALVWSLYPSRQQSDRAVVIGSKKFPESQLLADMLAELARARGIPVHMRHGLAGTIAFTALQTGEIDVYVEYTGTGLREILKERSDGTPQQVYDRVRQEFASRWSLVWLDPIGFEDKYALAMRSDAARAAGAGSLSDLARVSPTLVFGPTHEFLKREDGYPMLRRVYGLQFARAEPMEHGLAYRALQQGKIDVIDVYTTDGSLDPATITVLEDDKRAFPPYYAAPVVREEALRRVAGLRDALNGLKGRIDDSTMQRLNSQVEQAHRDSSDVAREFLVQQRLIAEGSADPGQPRGSGLLAYMWSHRGDLGRLTLQHLYLTGVSMALAVIVGIPIGIVISRFTAAAGPVLGAAGILQTVPSLALLAFMIPYLGLGRTPAIAALFLYGLLPIVRNTYAGIRGVEPELLEVAEGMGLTRGQRLYLVELPLASPVIMAGVRTAAVIAIGTATLAAFIGAGGLGDPIVSGLARYDDLEILSGAIPAALLAIVVDLLLGVVERLVVPRGIAAG